MNSYHTRDPLSTAVNQSLGDLYQILQTPNCTEQPTEQLNQHVVYSTQPTEQQTQQTMYSTNHSIYPQEAKTTSNPVVPLLEQILAEMKTMNAHATERNKTATTPLPVVLQLSSNSLKIPVKFDLPKEDRIQKQGEDRKKTKVENQPSTPRAEKRNHTMACGLGHHSKNIDNPKKKRKV